MTWGLVAAFLIGGLTGAVLAAIVLWLMVIMAFGCGF